MYCSLELPETLFAIPVLDTRIKVQTKSKCNTRVIGASRQNEQPEQVQSRKT